MPNSSIASLQNWFCAKKRSFPWRNSPTPYAVWISEIMLQQTRASVVVDYFNRWMDRFPTIEKLAQAEMQEVLKAWEGLGYYSRARHIKQAADTLFKEKRELPNSLEALLEIKGIGRYTAGAILSFAFHKKAAAIDGNVSRVVSRYFALSQDQSPKQNQLLLEEKTLSLLPDEKPFVVMEALIELGATFCQKNPLCHECPLKETCLAYLQNKTGEIPAKKNKQIILSSHRQVALILCQRKILLTRKKEGSLLGGLAQFPSFLYSLHEEVEEQIESYLNLQVKWVQDLDKTKQSFTKYQEELSPSVFSLRDLTEVSGFFWEDVNELQKHVFSSGHKRILQQFLQLINTESLCGK